MRHQTSQEYLWMIWTDPELNQELLQGLKDATRDFHNVIVVGNNDIHNQDFRQSINGLMVTTTTATPTATTTTGNPVNRNGEDSPRQHLDSVVVSSSIMHGSKELLWDYYQASQTRILVETRLDADDALTGNFLETIQNEANTSISQTDKTDFRVWCADQYVDWRYYSPSEEMEFGGGGGGFRSTISSSRIQQQQGQGQEEESVVTTSSSSSSSNSSSGSSSLSHKGFLSPEADFQGCVAAGLSMAFQTKASVDQLPTKEHHRIREGLGSCDKVNQKCVRGLGTGDNDQSLLALRARTPTSTSMINVVASTSLLDTTKLAVDNKGGNGGTDSSSDRDRDSNSGSNNNVEEQQRYLWQITERDFAIGAQSVWALRDRFQQHLPDILLDAIAGLCKVGHSCRQSSKSMLTQLLKDSVATATAAKTAAAATGAL